MLLAVAALAPMVVSAQTLPANEGTRAELTQEIEAARTALLPQAEPLPQVTVRFQPRLNDLKAAAVSAETPAELAKARKDFGDWKTVVLRHLYGEAKSSPFGAASYETFEAQKIVEMNFVGSLRSQIAAQRVEAQASAVRAASLKPDSSWSGVFDNASSFGTSSPLSAGSADGAVKAEAPVGAARYQKLRDIAVHSWGASPKIVDAAIKEAMKQNVDPALVLSVIWQESRFNPKATSSCGARGLMQVMPDTGRGMGYSPDRLYSIKDNLEAGIKYLRNAANYLKLNVDLSDISGAPDSKIKALLASYNAGIGAVSKWLRQQGSELVRIPYAETRHYVQVIGAKLATLGETLGW